MKCYVESAEYEIDIAQLTADLLQENNAHLVTVSKHGQLVIDDMAHGPDYVYRREVWQLRPNGQGSTEKWADHEWEFCRSVKLTEGRYE